MTAISDFDKLFNFFILKGVYSKFFLRDFDYTNNI